MVVLDEVPLVTARVRVAGELATEYDPPDDQEPVISLDKEGNNIPTRSCYIESKSGAEFAVEVKVSDKYRLPRFHDAFVAEVFIDGQWMESRCLGSPFYPGMSSTIVISSTEFLAENERVAVSKFVFAPIIKTSDHKSADKLNSDIKRAETLGTIRVVLSTCRLVRSASFKYPVHHKGWEEELAEKALKGKAISHATSLTEMVAKPSTLRSTVQDRHLLGEIIFRYQSYQALQHEMIIPRTPSPEPSAAATFDQDPLSHLSESDIRRLALERLHDTQVKDEVSQVKHEAEERPRTPRPWKFVKLDDGREAVDLTDE